MRVTEAILKSVFAGFLIVIWASISWAGATVLDKDHVETLVRLATEIKEADARLNANYKELQLRLDDRGKIRLQEAQRAWIPYRDKLCRFIESIEPYSERWKNSELAEKRCLLEQTVTRVAELEKAERLINPDPVIVPGEGKNLSWPNHLGKSEDAGVTCLSGQAELQQQIEDRLGNNHIYTTACQIMDSIFMLLDENGGNGDPLGVLDLTRRGGPIQLMRGLPWLERILKDKSGTVHIVAGGAGLSQGLYGSLVSIYSTKSWEGLMIARSVGIDNQSSVLQCPEKGGYGYEATKEVLQETHKYEDTNGDGVEDVVVETLTTFCTSGKAKTTTKTFLATESGFKEVSLLQPSKKSDLRQP